MQLSNYLVIYCEGTAKCSTRMLANERIILRLHECHAQVKVKAKPYTI